MFVKCSKANVHCKGDVCLNCSFDQLVLEHRIDPERVLVNLGFLKRSEADPQRIPDQFLLYQSKARGMTCDSYLDEHPKVRQHLEQKLALENAFRGVNQPPPSPVPSQTDDVPEGQTAIFARDLNAKFVDVVDHSLRSEGRSKGETWIFEGVQSADLNERSEGGTENFGRHFEHESVCFEGRCVGFQGHLKDRTINFAVSTVSALFADDRVPRRYLESLMCRLRTGRGPDQAALAFDGYGLRWSWKLDSESISSCWLSGTDLDLLSLLEESIPADDWSMQPPTAGDWSVDPPPASDWLVRPPAADDWSVNMPCSDVDRAWNSAHSADSLRSCSSLPALQRPLSGLLPLTDGFFVELPDPSHNLTDGRNPGEFPRGGEIFCDCCGGHSDQQSSSAASASKSWDQLDTEDFYIDDGAEMYAASCLQAGAVPFHSTKISPSDAERDKDFDDVAQVEDENIWTYLLQTLGDLTETLV